MLSDLEDKPLYRSKFTGLAKDAVQYHAQVVCKDFVRKTCAQPSEAFGKHMFSVQLPGQLGEYGLPTSL